MAADREFKDMAKGTIKGAVLQDTRQRVFALEAVKEEVAAGALPNTNIAVPGILLASSKLMSVIRYVTGVPTANLLSEATVTSDGNIQLSTTNTTGDALIVKFR